MENDTVLQAILLLCSHFGKEKSGEVKPLTPTEYSRLATWLYQCGYTPADLLVREKLLIEQWQDPKGPKGAITQERLTGLIRRSASMGFALEKWQQQKLWILSRASSDYPKVLKEKLGDTRSPLLYCIGNKELLSCSGIGFVGSRNTNQDDTEYTQALAHQAVEQGFVVVSGGAKGVDQTSMVAALEAGGSAIGIVADSLLRVATKSHYRKALKEGRLLLLTPYYPEAGFSTGNAMGRNKYIYALSNGVVVVKSDETGGTWSGANENLKKQWVPLWVRELNYAGNQKLIALGGQPLSGMQVDFKELQLLASVSLKKGNELVQKSQLVPQPDLFSAEDKVPESGHEGAISDVVTKVVEVLEEPVVAVTESTTSHCELEGTPVSALRQSTGLSPFLDLFYQQLKEDNQKVHTPTTLLDRYPELHSTVIKKWLESLTAEGLLKREGRKLAYTVVEQVCESGTADKR